MDFLKTLGIENVNPGAATGKTWLEGTAADTLSVLSPVDGRLIAKVRPRDFGIGRQQCRHYHA